MSRLAREFDPDTPPPPSPSVDSPALGGASQAAADHVAADPSPSSGGAPGSLSPTSSAADVIPARLSEGVVFRPLRLLPVGNFWLSPGCALMFEGARRHVDTGSNRLQTFVDSDYAADETRRSTMVWNGDAQWWSYFLVLSSW